MTTWWPRMPAGRGPIREYELVDTGIFADGRWFDVVVEYAKADPDDILIRIAVTNMGPEPAPIQLLPTLWFRNTWSWGRPESAAPAPASRSAGARLGVRPIVGERRPAGPDPARHRRRPATLLFTENESNTERLWGVANAGPVRQGRLPPSGRRRRGRRGQPRAGRLEGRQPASLRHRTRSDRRRSACACALVQPQTARAARPVRRLRADVRRPDCRGRRLLCRRSAARTSAPTSGSSSGRPSPA